MTLKSLIDKPEKLIEFIDSHLHPKDNEKKQFGEVFTPMTMVNTMLNMLPQSVWSNPDLKWLDPAAGMGNFPISVYQRLMIGLSKIIPNKEKRKQYILEKMLYMCELNSKNAFMCKQIFDVGNNYRMNIHCGNSLTTDLTDLGWPAKYDIVVGNPPYNEELTRSGATALYHKFIERYIDMCRYLMFIVPSRWFSGGKGLDGFRKAMLKRKDIRFIRHIDDASKVFGNSVDIKGGVNYFLKDSKYSGKCDYDGSLVDLAKYDVLVNSKFCKIIDKLQEEDRLTDLYKGRCFGIESNDKRILVTPKTSTIRCYVSQQKGFKRYIKEKDILKDYDYWKVITAEASDSHGSGFGNIFVGKKDEVHSGSYISFKVRSKQAAESLVSYMRCKLPNLMLSLRKTSQHISEKVCTWIPLVPLDRIWTDQKVYEHFEFSSADIKLVSKAVVKSYKKLVVNNDSNNTKKTSKRSD